MLVVAFLGPAAIFEECVLGTSRDMSREALSMRRQTDRERKGKRTLTPTVGVDTRQRTNLTCKQSKTDSFFSSNEENRGYTIHAASV